MTKESIEREVAMIEEFTKRLEKRLQNTDYKNDISILSRHLGELYAYKRLLKRGGRRKITDRVLHLAGSYGFPDLSLLLEGE